VTYSSDLPSLSHFLCGATPPLVARKRPQHHTNKQVQGHEQFIWHTSGMGEFCTFPLVPRARYRVALSEPSCFFARSSRRPARLSRSSETSCEDIAVYLLQAHGFCSSFVVVGVQALLMPRPFPLQPQKQFSLCRSWLGLSSAFLWAISPIPPSHGPDNQIMIHRSIPQAPDQAV
jgi:hypothetical protein